MQQTPQRRPSATANFAIGALLAIPGLINLIEGLMGLGIGRLLCGIAALGYGLLLVREGLHIKKTGLPGLPQKRMILIGFGFLSVYMVGLFLKHAG
ncbi:MULTISPECIES: hypothetical protein [unclassified Massilia]|jgi:hypothetical protein|uniref:hypothetical protein n=1 Tax=unclassified Massilia TaxID=2609279 RepID=UPI0004E33370|nr:MULTISPECIES: hypothetical protein [unclassified Massilia]KFC72977.1 hypothetical protein FG94_01655 [Massilia sp. LC238]